MALGRFTGWPLRSGSGPSPPTTLAWVGIAVSALGVLDPQLWLATPSGLALVAVALVIALLRGPNWRALLFPVSLAAALGLTVAAQPEFRGDTRAYYVQLRSLFFDRDLDVENELREMKRPARRRLGARLVHPIGPAILWSPFYLASHVYVKASGVLGGPRHTADGYSDPYRRAPVLGTVVLALCGSWLLARMLARSYGQGVATVAVAGAALASPIVYYVFVVPTMAHGLTFGAAGALLWGWEAARRSPSLRTWALLGALFGLVCLVRWQGAVYVLLIAPLALWALKRGAAARWLFGAAAASLLVFVPQMIVWRLRYGSFATIPRGPGFVDWYSPHFVDAMLSADHGLLTWSPIALLGVVGLLAGLRSDPLLHGGALAVFLSTAWVNGGVADWAAGDAYGARRFDLVFPLVALGLACFIAFSVEAVRRRPLLPAAAVVLLLVLWNLGQLSLFRENRYPQALPLERLAADQARMARLLAQDLGGALAGDAGRALAYKILSADYLFARFNRSGVLRLGFLDKRDLSGEWSPGHCGPGEVPYRWARPPDSCVRIPVDTPFGMDLTLRVRAPEAMQPQTMTIRFNDRAVAVAQVPDMWSEIRTTVPETNVKAGENWLCLGFARSAVVKGGARLAAAVATVEIQ